MLRSIGAARTGAAPVSTIVDGAETFGRLLDHKDWQTGALLARATRLMAFKRKERLARTNAGSDPTAMLASAAPGPRILVVDRAADETFLGATASPVELYAQMLDLARERHPDAIMVVKRDATARPAIERSRLRSRDILIENDIDVVALVEQVDAVYTVGGLTGLEALLVGRPVTCLGRPFYAGLGLTEDLARETGALASLSREALFAAAYLLLPRYVDPLTGSPCEAEVAFARLAAFKRHAHRVSAQWVGLNIPPVKRELLRAFLAGPCSSFTASPPRALAARPEQTLVAWAARPNAAVRRARRECPDRIVNIEDGFIRSVGLGSGFQPAASLVLDRLGIHYDPSSPSELDRFIAQAAADPSVLERASALRRQVVELGLSKYNLEAGAGVAFRPVDGRRSILVPGQVANDASVTTGGGGLSNLDLLQRVRREAPDAFLIYRPHPDVVAGHRPGAVSRSEASLYADLVAESGDVVAWIDAVDEVHTLTSQTGFEALLRDKPVVTYGRPFYSGRGLTRDRAEAPGPEREPATIDALVGGALILYPLYLDPVSLLPCDAETFVSRIGEMREKAPRRAAPRLPGLRYIEALRQMIAPVRPRAY